MSIFPRSNLITNEKLLSIAEKLKSPFWAYDAEIIKSKVNQLKQFDVIRYAQKANSNVNVLRLMRALGTKIDSVSLGEIERALVAGFTTDEIVFTADVLDDETQKRVVELEIDVNAGSIDMLKRLKNHKVWVRINPGFGHGHSKKTNTGGENSKHGIWFEDLPIALSVIKSNNLKLIGFHMHIGSGLFSNNFARVCDAMVEHIIASNVDIEAISAGGGIPTPYRENEESINVQIYFDLWNEAKKKIEKHLNHSIKMEVEPGRFLVAESGIFVAKVHAVKTMGSKRYALVNAGFNDLMRPAMYGSYHHITIIGDTSSRPVEPIVIAGHLCESGDVFTQLEGGIVDTRNLPKIEVGDHLIFHDTGAYGSSMSSNYNSRLLMPEVLFDANEVKIIRRKQTIEELINLESAVETLHV
jgi:diaminopimelate decarboxylase